MSYAEQAPLRSISYSNIAKPRVSNTYLQKASKNPTKLIRVEYASKKTSVKRIKYDLRKLNTNKV